MEIIKIWQLLFDVLTIIVIAVATANGYVAMAQARTQRRFAKYATFTVFLVSLFIYTVGRVLVQWLF